MDSPLEGDGFEVSVPGREIVKPSWETGLLSRKGERICWGTEGSNQSPSSGESSANLTEHGKDLGSDPFWSIGIAQGGNVGLATSQQIGPKDAAAVDYRRNPAVPECRVAGKAYIISTVSMLPTATGNRRQLS